MYCVFDHQLPSIFVSKVKKLSTPILFNTCNKKTLRSRQKKKLNIVLNLIHYHFTQNLKQSTFLAEWMVLGLIVENEEC